MFSYLSIAKLYVHIVWHKYVVISAFYGLHYKNIILFNWNRKFLQSIASERNNFSNIPTNYSKQSNWKHENSRKNIKSRGRVVAPTENFDFLWNSMLLKHTNNILKIVTGEVTNRYSKKNWQYMWSLNLFDFDMLSKHR